MIKTGIGISLNSDSLEAGKEAAKRAIAGVEKPNLIIATASIDFEQEKVVEGIKSICGKIPLIGGSPGWGNITTKGVGDKEVAVLAVKFEKIKFATEYVEELTRDSFRAGLILGEKLLKKCTEPPKLILLFFQGIGGVLVDEFLKGLKEKLGGESSVLGGGTGNEMGFPANLTTYQYCDRVLAKGDGAAAVGFWGDFFFSLGVEHGWEPIGLLMEVTKSKGNIICEIDGKPATEVYERYCEKTREEVVNPKFFTPKGEGLIHPLGFILKEPERILVRQVVGATKRGELIITTPVPKEGKCRLLHGIVEEMPVVAKGVAERTLSQLEKKEPQLTFLFNCVTRKALLMPDYQKEVEAIKKVIGEKSPLFGYYSYGEVCSRKEEKSWFSHNETLSMGILSE